MAPEQDVTALLVAWGQGDREADSRLMALVHAAYVRLVDLRRMRWQNRAQFFAIATRLMRQILADHARTHAAVKRGGVDWKVPLSDDVGTTVTRDVDLLGLDAALERLATLDPGLGDLVVRRFFGKLTVEETADVLARPPATIKRDWTRARAWLFRELRSLIVVRDPCKGRP